jgi:hypothetical protein
VDSSERVSQSDNIAPIQGLAWKKLDSYNTLISLLSIGIPLPYSVAFGLLRTLRGCQ